MIEDKILTVDLELQSIKEIEGDFHFVSKSLNKDFECEKGRTVLAKESIGKPYIWRHKHPLQKGNEDSHVYGKVVNSWLEDGEIFSEYKVYNHTEEHKAIIDIIKERHDIGKPLGVSMRYRKYLEDDKPIHYDVFEHSGTPYPKCPDCKEIKVGVKTVTNEEKNIKEEKALEKIEELEELLNSKTDIINELKNKAESLENEMKMKDEQLEDKKVVEQTLEEKIADLVNEVEYLKKKPILDKILEVRKLDDVELGIYKEQSIKYLEGKYEQFKKEGDSKVIVIETQNESSEKTKEKAEEELEKKVKVPFEDFVKFTNIKVKDGK